MTEPFEHYYELSTLNRLLTLASHPADLHTLLRRAEFNTYVAIHEEATGYIIFRTHGTETYYRTAYQPCSLSFLPPIRVVPEERTVIRWEPAQ